MTSGEVGERAPEEIRAEIEETREKLGDKTQAAAPESPAEAQALVKQNLKPLAIAGGLIALLVLWRLLRR